MKDKRIDHNLEWPATVFNVVWSTECEPWHSRNLAQLKLQSNVIWLTCVLLGVTPIDQPLVCVASIWNTIKGEETAAQDIRVMTEVKSRCRKLLSMRLTELVVASCWIWTWLNWMLQVAEYALYQIDLNDTSCHNWYDLTWSYLT